MMRSPRLIVAILALALAGCHSAVPGALVLTPGTPAAPQAAAPAPQPAAVPVAAPAPRKAERVRDQLVLSLAGGQSAEAFMRQPAASGLTLVRSLAFNGRYVLTVRVASAVSLEAERSRLAGVTGVESVYFNTLAYAHAASSDPRAVEQWAHKPQFANTEGAWGRLTGVDQSKVIVAMIDTGCDIGHEEFAGRIVGARSVVAGATDTSDVSDPIGHGTLTSGIMGADGGNGKGVAGVAWGVKIMPIKADHFEEDLVTNSFSLDDILAGLKYACDYTDAGGAKVRVINMSLGENVGGIRPLYAEAVAYARQKGILIVASTGNSGSDVVGTPANTPGAVAVGSTSSYLDFEIVSPFSNYGERLDVLAPGGGILAPIPTTPNRIGEAGGNDVRGYGYASGTSEAAPYVSGLAALIFAKYDPNNASTASAATAAAMVDKVRLHLQKSVDDLGVPGWDPGSGFGRVNADKALSAATL